MGEGVRALCVLGDAQHVGFHVEHLREAAVHLGFYRLDAVAQGAQLWYGRRYFLVHDLGIGLAVFLALLRLCLFLLLCLKRCERFGLFLGHFDLYFVLCFHYFNTV